MEILVPAHQFEIRYKKIINFSSMLDDLIAPFTKTSNDVQIENEGSREMVCSLIYENYFVQLRWDRIIFRYDGTLENVTNLSKSNSSMENPFFRVFDTIKENKGFGGVLHFVCYSLVVKPSENTIEQERSDFVAKNLNKENLKKMLDHLDDASIVLEKKDGSKTVSITAGPYKGVEDLRKRNAEPKTAYLRKSLKEVSGQMADIRVAEFGTKVDFTKYKECINQTNEIIKQLWS